MTGDRNDKQLVKVKKWCNAMLCKSTHNKIPWSRIDVSPYRKPVPPKWGYLFDEEKHYWVSLRLECNKFDVLYTNRTSLWSLRPTEACCPDCEGWFACSTDNLEQLWNIYLTKWDTSIMIHVRNSKQKFKTYASYAQIMLLALLCINFSTYHLLYVIELIYTIYTYRNP